MRCPQRFRANGQLTRAGCSFDIDLPTECDDEYWTASEPELAFKQPLGKPSKITFFNCYVRLHQILAFAMRTIVSLRLLSPCRTRAFDVPALDRSTGNGKGVLSAEC